MGIIQCLADSTSQQQLPTYQQPCIQRCPLWTQWWPISCLGSGSTPGNWEFSDGKGETRRPFGGVWLCFWRDKLTNKSWNKQMLSKLDHLQFGDEKQSKSKPHSFDKIISSWKPRGYFHHRFHVSLLLPSQGTEVLMVAPVMGLFLLQQSFAIFVAEFVPKSQKNESSQSRMRKRTKT